MNIPLMQEYEDHLPPNQGIIQTKGVKNLRLFMQLAIEKRKLAAIVGKAGRGKTIAIQSFVDQHEPQAHTGLLPVIKVKVKQETTSKALALDILASMGEKNRGRNKYELADEVAQAVVRNDLKLLIVDEADMLNVPSFNLLRRIHDITGCPVVVVGLERLLQIIRPQELFESRVGLTMKFPSISKREMLDVVLPGLVVPFWTFDPHDSGDRQMGEEIYLIVRSSFRRLRNLLDIASKTAELYEDNRITLATIHDALKWTPEGIDDMDDEEGERPGEYEIASEIRHDAKNKKVGQK